MKTSPERYPQARRRPAVILLCAAIGLFAGAFGVFVAREPSLAVAAAGPCGTSHDGLSAEESEFVGLLEAWRAARHFQSSALEVSAPLNAAAAWFAEYLVNGGELNGHFDSYGRNWFQRAIDCGYDPYYAQGSGEGVGFIAGSGINPASFGATEGLQLVDYPGSGITINAGGSLPAKCVGVGVYRSENAVAWIVVIAQWQAGWACPQDVTGESASPTPTSSPSPTPSPTPMPTPTPILAPEWRAYAPNVVSNP